MLIDENLKTFLQSNFNNSVFGEFFGKKLLIIALLRNKEFDKNENLIFCFEEDQIFKFKDQDFVQISLSDFNLELKNTLDLLKTRLNHYQDLLEHKENSVLKGKNIENILRKIFILRQKIAKALKLASQLHESLSALANEQNELKKSLKFIIFTALSLEKNAKELSLRVDSLYTLIIGIKNEKMNKNIYILSIISTIVLPLNLIVGFFGMNTGGLFLAQNEYGSLIILLTMCAIALLGVGYYYTKAKERLNLDEDFKKLTKDKNEKYLE
ncbi:CorA family divalent cation transporter [Campylobacter sp. MIT 12-5580]|uniref:CorA family divalent cation transporter n=1 Tax=Campylobacter sp. MIT 12-5580 TaxID=2040651 RepID=UPI0010F6BFF8|nr:CorA family divalent cation transporter [Campylobacter sp. MIT 12-5580]